MSNRKFDSLPEDEKLKIKLEEMRSCIRIYDDAPAIDKIPPIWSKDMENVKWTLGDLVTHLDDETIREKVGPEVSAEIDRAVEIKEHLTDAIRRSWQL